MNIVTRYIVWAYKPDDDNEVFQAGKFSTKEEAIRVAGERTDIIVAEIETVRERENN